MSGELKLINIMLVVLLGVWLGTAINAFTVPSGATIISLPSASGAASPREAAQANPSPGTNTFDASVDPGGPACPANEIPVLIATGMDGARPVIPEDAERYCVTAGPLPGGLTAAGGWCYALEGSLACSQVLDERGGAWSCRAALGASPAWQDFSYSRPACVPRISTGR